VKGKVLLLMMFMILASGCVKGNEAPLDTNDAAADSNAVESESQCGEGFIPFGNRCCPDLDSNGVCTPMDEGILSE